MMTVLYRKEGEYIGKQAFPVHSFFNAEEEEEWYEDPVVRQIIKDIDRNEWVTGHIFKSPVMGDIIPSEFSGGVKSLILVLKGTGEWSPRVFRSTQFGDNCVKWLAKISFERDFTLVMTHCMQWFYDIPICAQTEDGKPLNTCNEVGDYYFDEFSKTLDPDPFNHYDLEEEE